jgi:hypothetical protein
MLTMVAVISVTQTTMKTFRRLDGNPSARASSSPIASRLIRQLTSSRSSVPTPISGPANASFGQLAPPRPTSSQKVMAGSFCWGSATYSVTDINAENIDATITPLRTSMTTGVVR